MANLPSLKLVFPAFLAVLTLALLTLCLLSWRPSATGNETSSFELFQFTSILHGSKEQGQQGPPLRLAVALAGNLSRALAGVEARAMSLKIDLRQLGATANVLAAHEARRDLQRRIEAREKCDTAWWWWNAMLRANAADNKAEVLQNNSPTEKSLKKEGAAVADVLDVPKAVLDFRGENDY